jgi:hypothetical protein
MGYGNLEISVFLVLFPATDMQHILNWKSGRKVHILVDSCGGCSAAMAKGQVRSFEAFDISCTFGSHLRDVDKCISQNRA